MPHDPPYSHVQHDHAGHDHAHAHGPGGHSHTPKNFGPAFAVGTALNLGFVIVETVFGLLSHSMALVADAGHNLGDVLGLIVAWAAAVLVRRRPSGRYTYGLRGSSILAALFNAVVLLIATGAISVETARRFFEPAPVHGRTVVIVAAVGIVINGVTAVLFMSGRKGDLNIRGAFLHMASDAVLAAGVVLAGFVILLTGWSWIDPAVSLLLVVVIAAAAWGLLRDSVNMSLQAVPPGIDIEEVEGFLHSRAGVAAVHDLHVWPMSTTETALTAHLLTPAGYPGDDYAAQIAEQLRRRFGIGHTTLQIETDPTTSCTLEPADVV